MSSEPVIEVRNVSKSYLIYDHPSARLKQILVPRFMRAVGREPRAYFKEHHALRDVSFSVRPGETVGIIGRNGSGKSTLLQIICGTLQPTHGEVRVRGRIGALLELGAGFNPEFTGRQNAVLNAQILGLTDAEIAARMDAIEAFADIGDFFDRPVKMYSSGMYVRVAFAVQACIDPDILVVDEALAVGDEKFQRKCFDRFETLRARGTAILLVTHSTTAIERFCQRAVLLHQGSVHGIGPSNVIIDQYHALLYADEKAYLQLLNREAPPAPEAPPALAPVAEEAAREEPARARAQIVACAMTDAQGETQEVFRPGEQVRIAMIVRCLEDIEEMQAGISIKTVEGVHGFGTSTLYHDGNLKNLTRGETVTISFDMTLALCDGVYFVSLAAAIPISRADMRYLDKRSDAIVFKVAERRLKATGIAYLPATIACERTP
jgi:lipopolysaccharide transport system ATP-binding protein